MSTEWIITIPHSFERPSNHKNQNGDNDIENMNDVMTGVTDDNDEIDDNGEAMIRANLPIRGGERRE